MATHLRYPWYSKKVSLIILGRGGLDRGGTHTVRPVADRSGTYGVVPDGTGRYRQNQDSHSVFNGECP